MQGDLRCGTDPCRQASEGGKVYLDFSARLKGGSPTSVGFSPGLHRRQGFILCGLETYHLATSITENSDCSHGNGMDTDKHTTQEGMSKPDIPTKENGKTHHRLHDANNNEQPPLNEVNIEDNTDNKNRDKNIRNEMEPKSNNKEIRQENEIIKRNQRGQRTNYRRPRPHERQHNSTILQNVFSSRSFTKFFLIKATDPNLNFAKISIIHANQQLKETLNGERAKKVNELKDGSLLVEVSSEEQSRLILNLRSLDGIAVTITKHNSLNQIKGSIYFRNKYNYTKEQIIEELSEYNVTDVYNITRKANDVTIPTNIFILTFDSNHLPEEVYIGWKACDVREYIPRPRRCFKCQGFQHSSTTCRSEVSYCVNCGQQSHDTPCNGPPNCRNCNEAHQASSKECFYYKLALEIITLQTRNKLTYHEARKKALSTLIGPNRSYASIVASGTSHNIVQRHEVTKTSGASNFIQPTSNTPKNIIANPTTHHHESRKLVSPESQENHLSTTQSQNSDTKRSPHSSGVRPRYSAADMQLRHRAPNPGPTSGHGHRHHAPMQNNKLRNIIPSTNDKIYDNDQRKRVLSDEDKSDNLHAKKSSTQETYYKNVSTSSTPRAAATLETGSQSGKTNERPIPSLADSWGSKPKHKDRSHNEYWKDSPHDNMDDIQSSSDIYPTNQYDSYIDKIQTHSGVTPSPIIVPKDQRSHNDNKGKR